MDRHSDRISWIQELAKSIPEEEIKDFLGIHFTKDEVLRSNQEKETVFNIYQGKKLLFHHINRTDFEHLFAHFGFYLCMKLCSEAPEEKNHRLLKKKIRKEAIQREIEKRKIEESKKHIF